MNVQIIFVLVIAWLISKLHGLLTRKRLDRTLSICNRVRFLQIVRLLNFLEDFFFIFFRFLFARLKFFIFLSLVRNGVQVQTIFSSGLMGDFSRVEPTCRCLVQLIYEKATLHLLIKLVINSNCIMQVRVVRDLTCGSHVVTSGHGLGSELLR